MSRYPTTSGGQPLDATLTSIAGLGTAADKMLYTTGVDTWAELAVTSVGRGLLDDTTQAAQQTTLGLGTGDSPQFTAINVGHASDTTIARSAAGKITVEGNLVPSIADPNADRILIWDDSAGDYVAATLSSNLVISGTAIRVYEVWGGAISDETTAITTGTGKLSFSIPYEFNVVGVYATLNTASSSGTPTFDINEAGTTIISTKIVIDANEFTGGSAGYQGTAAAAAVISDAVIAAFAQITVDIDVAGTGAKGAKVFIVGYRT